MWNFLHFFFILLEQTCCYFGHFSRTQKVHSFLYCLLKHQGTQNPSYTSKKPLLRIRWKKLILHNRFPIPSHLFQSPFKGSDSLGFLSLKIASLKGLSICLWDSKTVLKNRILLNPHSNLKQKVFKFQFYIMALLPLCDVLLLPGKRIPLIFPVVLDLFENFAAAD